MISKKNVLSKFSDFTLVASPLLYLHDDEAYEAALEMVESLMEQVGDDASKPENLLIMLLGHAIKVYESHHEDISAFVQQATKDKPDVIMLRFIIDQHNLTLADLPEIGHKSLVSRIISGERNLTKSHIDRLSKRFHLDPGLFF